MIKAQHEMYSTMRAIRRLSRNSCTFTTNVRMRTCNQWERQRVPEQQIHTATAISQRHCGICRDESRNTRRRLLRETRSAHDAYYTVMISNPELFSGTCDHRGTRQRDAMTSTGHAALGCVRNYTFTDSTSRLNLPGRAHRCTARVIPSSICSKC